MTEQDRLRAVLFCSAILETAKKLEADFAKLKQAAEDFAYRGGSSDFPGSNPQPWE
jgi:hypothetical protein